jgi:ribosomal protein S18 acetylase RimI-like enzyme
MPKTPVDSGEEPTTNPSSNRIDPAGLSYEVVGPQNQDQLRVIEELELLSYGRAGINFWTLVPMAQYGRVYLGTVDGKAMTWAVVLTDAADPTKVCLFSFGVTKGQRRRGIGSAALTELLSRLGAAGVRTVEVAVSPDNVAGINLCRRRFDFELVKILTDWYGAGEGRHLLTKQL